MGSSQAKRPKAAINFATAPDPDHQNHQPDILDRVNDPTISGAETEQVRLALQFLHAGRGRIDGQRVHALFDPFLVLAWKLS